MAGARARCGVRSQSTILTAALLAGCAALAARVIPAAALAAAAASAATHAAARPGGTGTHPQHAAAAAAAAHAAEAAGASALRAAQARWPDGYVALCTVVKDQPRDLRWWIAYHRWLGVDKFYIMDHNSSRPMLPALMDWVRDGVVEYAYFTGRPRRLPSFTDSNQWRGYHGCIAAHARRHAWLGLLDADEFVVFQPGAQGTGGSAAGSHNLPLLLARLEAAGAGALALNWVLFGSSGHKTRPRGGPLASYTACVPASHPESSHTKIIAHTGHLLDMGPTPHEVVLQPGARLVDADGVPTTAPRSNTSRVATLALYHYVLKSRAEFGDKMARGSGAGNLKTWEYWEYLEPLATATCTHGINVSAMFMDSDPRIRLERPQQQQQQQQRHRRPQTGR